MNERNQEKRPGMNILFKTTTHVSIGDDISFLGTKKLFNRVIPGHNAFLYSRGEKDTWKPTSKIKIDLAVVAGTPIWSGSQMASLEDFIIENSIPTFYCGVGMNYGDNSKTSKALANAIGFIGRDNHAAKRAKRDFPDAVAICCPSIFAADPAPTTDSKIGIILQVDTWLEEQVRFVQRFSPSEALIICNEIVDYIWAEENLPGYEIVYSRWLFDMVGYYLRCKEIYSMRIHGAHLAYALGIPTVCLKSEKDKSVVCQKIGLELVRPDDVTPADLRHDESLRQKHYAAFLNYITLHVAKAFPGVVPVDLLEQETLHQQEIEASTAASAGADLAQPKRKGGKRRVVAKA